MTRSESPGPGGFSDERTQCAGNRLSYRYSLGLSQDLGFNPGSVLDIGLVLGLDQVYSLALDQT